jgi:hypothetical protein
MLKHGHSNILKEYTNKNKYKNVPIIKKDRIENLKIKK